MTSPDDTTGGVGPGPEDASSGPEAVGEPNGPTGGTDDFDVDVLEAELIDGIVEAEGDPLAEAEAQRDEYLDALRRLQAEFENYRKRVTTQQADQVARAALGLVEKLLPVLDTLDLAAQHIGDPESSDAKALVAAASQLQDVLAKEGLERVDPAGDVFDPNAHEAVGQVPAEEGAGESSDGPTVAQVLRAGYRWKGTVVRPAMVMVTG
jgi:molecular chaperone GrpE